MDIDSEQVSTLRRDVARLGAQVHALRLVVLRLPAIVALVLIVVGLVLPAWSGETDGEQVTDRVLTVGVTAISEPVDEFGVAAGIGFLGLVVVLLLLCGVLVNSVIAGHGSAEGARARGVLETLALVGSVVASLFSFAGWASDEPDVTGGVGPLVLLVGVIAAVAVLRYQPWQDLWIHRSGRR